MRRPLNEQEQAAEVRKRENNKLHHVRQWSLERFSTRHLGRSIHAQLFGILEADECVAVAAAVDAELGFRLYYSGRHKMNREHPEVAQTPRFIGILEKEDPRTNLKHFVSIETIRDLVLSELRNLGRSPGGGGNARFRAAHVIYALSTHGRLLAGTSQGRRSGTIVEPQGTTRAEQWQGAEAFVDWLVKAYDDLPITTVIAAPRDGGDSWWRLNKGPDAPPLQVVKRHKKLRRRGIAQPFVDPREAEGDSVKDRALAIDDAAMQQQRKVDALIAAANVLRDPSSAPERDDELVEFLLAEAGAIESAEVSDGKSAPALSPTLAGIPYEPFIRGKFKASVEGALAGRNLGEEASENIVDWVLWNLNGQEVVLTSQLGAGVAECLRRVDDLAYMKWVIVAKELRVAAIYREAIGLVAHPSPKLAFDRSASQPPRPTTKPRQEP